MAFLPFSGNNLELERCPHCNVDRPFISVVGSQQFETRDHLKLNLRYWKTYFCHRCGGVILVGTDNVNSQVDEMYPESAQELDDSVPPKAREYFKQAQNSLHAPAGAVILAASAVDAMLKATGYKDGTLNARIKKAAQDHLITDDMAQWAHQVRLDANDQRHSDDDAPLPDERDARRSLEFAKALAQFLFVFPAMVKKGIQESKEPGKA
jgi:hypothetical protein